MILALILAGCTGGSSRYLRFEKGKKQPLKLLIAKDAVSFEIVINSDFKIEAAGVSSFKAKGLKAEIEKQSIIIDKKSYGNRLKILPDNNIFILNGSKYRGNLALYIEDGTLNAIEDFTMEDYLYGVVGMEMSGSSPIEALKAQAVAARTFAYYEMSSKSTKEYDMDNLPQAQAYSGMESENPNSIDAVNLTFGEIMRYKGQPIFAAFSANCGGYTEDNKEVFGYKLPYLQAVPCPFCKGYQHSSWQEEIQTSYIIERLKKKGFDAKTISSIEITDTSKAGRVKQIAIITDKGKIKMTTNDFRLTLGSDKFKSARFTTRSKGANILFTGRGWGHGVGMCQDGADNMARVGNSYRRILTRYYAGIELGTK